MPAAPPPARPAGASARFPAAALAAAALIVLAGAGCDLIKPTREDPADDAGAPGKVFAKADAAAKPAPAVAPAIVRRIDRGEAPETGPAPSPAEVAAAAARERADARQSAAEARVRVEPFDTLPDGRAVTRYRLDGGGGFEVAVLDLGGVVTEVTLPDAAGEPANVVLRHDTAAAYLGDGVPLGGVVGRYAGRLGGGTVPVAPLGERTAYTEPMALPGEDGEVTRFGGDGGWHRAIWAAEVVPAGGGGDEVFPALRLTRTSPDGEGGFPGAVAAVVTIAAVRDAGGPVLSVVCEATADRPTPLAPTHHLYWNLAGAGSGNVLAHRLKVEANGGLVEGPDGRPTGEVGTLLSGPAAAYRFGGLTGRPVEGVGPRGKPLRDYDFIYVLQSGTDLARPAAVLRAPSGGRSLAVFTDAPGLHVESGAGLPKNVGGRHAGLLLAPQQFPDAPHGAFAHDGVLRPGETFRQTTLYRFSPR